MKFTRRLALSLALGVAASAFAEPTTHKPLTDFVHERWTVDDGLPQNSVLAIRQTRNGYLWFGTHEGVARYDGRQFNNFAEGNTPALAGSGVPALEESSDGALWLGLRDGGVARFVNGRFDNLKAVLGLPKYGVAAIRASGSQVWFGTQGGGVYRAALTAQTPAKAWRREDGLPENTVSALYVAADGTAWVGTPAGLAAIVGDKVDASRVPAALASEPISAVAEHQGAIWVGTPSSLLRLEGNKVAARYDRSNGLTADAVTRLLSHHDTLWVGTRDGLVRWHGGRFDRTDSQAGLPNNYIRDLWVDGEDSLWVGTQSGLGRLRDGIVTMLGARRGIADEFVRAVFQDRAGNRWVGTGSALYRVDSSEVRRFAAESGLVPPAIVGLNQTRRGELLVGTIGGGAQQLHDRRFLKQTGPSELANATVRDLFEAADGTRWFATQVGLIQVNADGTSRRWLESDGMPNQQVLALHGGADGSVWIGTSGGLARLRAGRIQTFDNINQRLSTVLAITPDGSDALWLGTQNGLTRVTQIQDAQPQFQSLSGSGALPVRAFFSALADDVGGLWMCSTQGIVRAAIDSLRSYKGGDARVAYSVIGRGEGMASVQCNGSSQPAAARMQDGSLWFATVRGVAMVNPRAAQSGPDAPPPVVLSEVFVNGRPVASVGEVVQLEAGRNRIEVTYTALRFVNPQRVQYRYRLNGLSDWQITSDRKAVFEALPPGRYTFQLSARNAEGHWGEPLDGVLVLQSPHFWQRAWVQVAFALGLPLVVFALYRFRIEGLKRRNAHLESLVATRTAALADETRRLTEANTEKAALLIKVGDQAEAFARMAREDALTGIANRRELDARLREEYERASRHRYPLSVAIVDADHFKQVNDRFGHAAGDEVLRRLGKVLRETAREIDFVARFGGEEFVLVLPHTSGNQAFSICERVRKAVMEQAWSEVAPDLRVTVSIGVAESNFSVDAIASGDSHEKLLSRADERLYEAKQGGRNRVAVAT